MAYSRVFFFFFFCKIIKFTACILMSVWKLVVDRKRAHSYLNTTNSPLHGFYAKIAILVWKFVSNLKLLDEQTNIISHKKDMLCINVKNFSICWHESFCSFWSLNILRQFSLDWALIRHKPSKNTVLGDVRTWSVLCGWI